MDHSSKYGGEVVFVRDIFAFADKWRIDPLSKFDCYVKRTKSGKMEYLSFEFSFLNEINIYRKCNKDNCLLVNSHSENIDQFALLQLKLERC